MIVLTMRLKNYSSLDASTSQRAAARLKAIIDGTPSKCVRFGGQVDAPSCYISPTLLDFGTNLKSFSSSAAMAEELFGPILPCFRYSSLDQAVSFVNGRPKPLSCYLFTTSSSDRSYILTNTTAGSSNVNDVMMHMCNPSLPFGGVGESGMGRYHGKYSFDCFTHYKSVLFKSNVGDVWARYPRYDSLKETALGLVQKTRPGWFWAALKWLVIAVVLGGVRGWAVEDGRPAEAAHAVVDFLLK